MIVFGTGDRRLRTDDDQVLADDGAFCAGVLVVVLLGDRLARVVTSDRKLWATDQGTHKILGYDLQGHFVYSWGTWGEYPGGMWGVHGMSTDQEGNFYVAEVNNGRIQKYRPRQGANPQFLVGKPWKGVW